MKALALLTAAALTLLRTDRTVLRQGQSPAATGCYQRLVRVIGGPAIVPVPFFLSEAEKRRLTNSEDRLFLDAKERRMSPICRSYC